MRCGYATQFVQHDLSPLACSGQVGALLSVGQQFCPLGVSNTCAIMAFRTSAAMCFPN